MIRLRIAGGVVTPKQWLILDDIARTYANGTLRATTRQTFQYPWRGRRPPCGRRSGPGWSPTSRCGSRRRRPRWCREIWLDGERVVGGEDEAVLEPVYGKTYLPRKFKTGEVVGRLVGAGLGRVGRRHHVAVHVAAGRDGVEQRGSG
jgi:sulfite reductase (NADPH) hemoprotein beta-component